MADRLGMPVEEGIKETVVMLNAFDLRTSQSCEGHLEKEKIGGPWVTIRPREPKVEEWWEDEKLRERMTKQRLFMKKRMVKLLNLFYEKRKVSWDVRIGMTDAAYMFSIENNGSAFLEVMEEKEREKKFKQYKKEIEDFTKFLKEKYPDYLFKRLEI